MKVLMEQDLPLLPGEWVRMHIGTPEGVVVYKVEMEGLLMDACPVTINGEPYTVPSIIRAGELLDFHLRRNGGEDSLIFMKGEDIPVPLNARLCLERGQEFETGGEGNE